MSKKRDQSNQLDLADVWTEFEDYNPDPPAKVEPRPVRASTTRVRYTGDKTDLLRIPISRKAKERFFSACEKRGVVASQVVRDLVEFWVEFEWIGREANHLQPDLLCSDGSRDMRSAKARRK